MNSFQHIGRIVVLPLTLSAMMALPLAAPSISFADNGSTTVGNSHSNPDGAGVNKPYPADGQGAYTQGPGAGSYSDGNNGSGNDIHNGGGCDDNNGKQPACSENQQIPFAPLALAYPALGAIGFGGAAVVRKMRRQPAQA